MSKIAQSTQLPISSLGFSMEFVEEKVMNAEKDKKEGGLKSQGSLGVSDYVTLEPYMANNKNELKDHIMMIDQGKAQKISALKLDILGDDRKIKDFISKSLNSCIHEDVKFNDPKHILNKENIFSEKTKINRLDPDYWENLKIYSLNMLPTTLFEGIECPDLEFECVVNGGFETFASSLFILASLKPQLISRLFEVQEINKEGLYAVWVNTCGEWKLVVLDDKFPFYWGEGAFVKTKLKESSNVNMFWTLLIEKAIAKTFGGYDMLQDLNIDQALGDLTGCPYEFKDHEDEEELWNDAREWYENGFLAFLALKPSALNMPENISYYFPIFDTISILLDGGVKKFIKLRAPNKDLVIKSKTLMKAAESLANAEYDLAKLATVETFFWLSINELRDYFSTIGCLKYHACYYYNSLKVNTNKNGAVILMHVDSDCKCYIGIHQIDERVFRSREEIGIYHYSFIRLLVAKIESEDLSNIKEGALKWVAGEFSNDRVIWKDEQRLEKGYYLIAVEGEWISGCRDFNLVTYSSIEDIKLEPYKQPVDFLSLQKTIIQSLALNNINYPNQKIRDYSKQNEPEIKVYFDMNFGMLYFCYQNNGTKVLRETVTMTSLKNLIICAPYSNNRFFNVELAPGESETVLYKYDISGDEFSYQSTVRSTIEAHSLENQQQRLDLQTYLSDLEPKKILREEKNILHEEKENKEEMAQYINSLKFTNVDLMRFMEQNSEKETRVWEGQAIDVFIYKYLHQGGIVILYLNYTDYPYEENVSFELNNLVVVNKNKDGNLNVAIKAYEYYFIFLNVLKAKDPYGFKIRSYYKYYPE